MNKRILGADLLLLLTAAVWGFGFVAQRSGMEYIGPFSFNGIRFILGSLSLLPLIFWRMRRKTSRETSKKVIFYSSFLAGSCLFIAVTLQQFGIMVTTAGNAGFITGLYVIFTPIFGIFLGKSTGKATWLGAILTLAGLYFLSFQVKNPSGPIVNPGDLFIAVSAVLWAFHVLIIDRLVQKTDPIILSAGQFFIAGVYALIAAFSLEPIISAWLETNSQTLISSGLFSWKSLPALIGGLSTGLIPLSLVASAVIPILYAGICSAGIGYTLQVVAQQYAPPAHATIILCLEGCFAALGGIILLNEPLGLRTVIGFSFILAGMLISQWEQITSRKA